MKPDNSIENTICTAVDSDELSRIRDFVKLKAEDFGFGDGDCNKIVLAVDEACSNLIEHAYKKDSTKLLCVEIDSFDKEFIVKILDNAIPFDPSNVELPDMEKYFKVLKRGGLGIKIMRLVMDEILYYPSNEHNPVNTLILKKHLN
ncbi:MAG: ATP-binding protein [Desulfobulbaceae bacterium]|nr:ATP-binding protein [Candidatus Kapabacteria bacterium]MBS4001500.1 ATP-binding protein [Desulfobulbaceae bacterium]